MVDDAQAAGYQVRVEMSYDIHPPRLDFMPETSVKVLRLRLYKDGPDDTKCEHCGEWKHFDPAQAQLTWRNGRFAPSESRVSKPDGYRHRANTVARAYKLLGILTVAQRAKLAALQPDAAPTSSDGEGTVPVLHEPGAHDEAGLDPHASERGAGVPR